MSYNVLLHFIPIALILDCVFGFCAIRQKNQIKNQEQQHLFKLSNKNFLKTVLKITQMRMSGKCSVNEFLTMNKIIIKY